MYKGGRRRRGSCGGLKDLLAQYSSDVMAWLRNGKQKHQQQERDENKFMDTVLRSNLLQNPCSLFLDPWILDPWILDLEYWTLCCRIPGSWIFDPGSLPPRPYICQWHAKLLRKSARTLKRRSDRATRPGGKHAAFLSTCLFL